MLLLVLAMDLEDLGSALGSAIKAPHKDFSSYIYFECIG